MRQSDDEETEAPRKLRSQTIKLLLEEEKEPVDLGVLVPLTGKALVCCSDLKRKRNLKFFKFQDSGYDAPLQRVFTPSFQQLIPKISLPLKVGKNTQPDLEYYQNTLKLHRKHEMIEKRIKVRDRDRILFELYNQQLEKEKKDRERIQKKLLRTDSAESLVQPDLELDQKEPSHLGKRRRKDSNEEATHYTMIWKGEYPHQLLGTKASSLVEKYSIKGLFWQDSNHHTDSSASLTKSAVVPLPTPKIRIKFKPQDPVTETVSTIPKLKLRRITFKPLKPVVLNTGGGDEEEDDGKDADGKDADFSIPIHVRTGSDSKEKEGDTSKRRCRATTAFGYPVPLIKRLDLDFSDPQWLVLNEAGIY
jgi:hypothetical protein